MASSNDGSDVDFDFFDDNSEKNNHLEVNQDSSAISVTVNKSESKASSASNSDYTRSRSTVITTSQSTSSKSAQRSRSNSSTSSRSSRLSDAASFSKSDSKSGSKPSSSTESLSSHFSSTGYSKSSRSPSEESLSKRGSAVKEDYSSSDSDVTDVSPLHSPHGKQPLAAKQFDSDEKDSYEDEPQPRKRPPSGKKNRGASAGDPINMRLLMEVLDMENNMSDGRYERSKKVDFMASNAISRKNYSFPNDTVDDIDRENHRLLQRIMQYKSEKEKLRKQYERKVITSHRKPVMTSAALNRKREQERIDKENLVSGLSCSLRAEFTIL